ncbi:YdeI/OmpD-associated family protein [Cohnella hashimotonis]|uniref:YdeI family protein n=1 Tax=Cohnella hashimotonis TaxID=2826895 RepID=A0ABT6TGH7_9BACL|nr:YdeI family protein [Cohnella hashimotonis]MDI4645926.1 YdeI family protein [Cohnella hashimotonis]
MTNRLTHPKAEAFFNKSKRWKAEYEELREIVMDCGLTEDFKWMHPCYTFQSKNVVLIHGFKEYCALLFHKGALLKDPNGILIQQTENVQAGRQIRFTNVQEIVECAAILKDYIQDAINVEKSGQEVVFKKNTEFAVAEELQREFDGNPALRKAFEALTPGRQRAYLLHFSQPKQAKTREARVEKYKPKILEGKGLDD